MARTWVAAVGALAATGLGVGIGLHRADKLRRGRAAFHRRPLEAAIGAGKTEAHRVRLWLRAPEPGRHELVVERQGGAPLARVQFDVPGGANDGTCALQYPDDFEGAPPLSAVTRYGLSVTHVPTGRCIGTARFETAPSGLGDTPERFALAVMSCHLPFDDTGKPSARARRLLEALPRLLDA